MNNKMRIKDSESVVIWCCIGMLTIIGVSVVSCGIITLLEWLK